jgi:hypothetical protein
MAGTVWAGMAASPAFISDGVGIVAEFMPVYIRLKP